MATRELGHLACWAAHAAAHVEHLHTRSQADVVREEVFVPGDRTGEGLAVREAAEMERSSPGVLVEVGGKVVIPVWVEDTIAGQLCTSDGLCPRIEEKVRST